MWGCWTRDWVTFTRAKPYLDFGYNAIDFTLSKLRGSWVLFFKDERSGYKAVRRLELGSQLRLALGLPGWLAGQQVSPLLTETLTEGPQLVTVPGSKALEPPRQNA